MPDAPASALFEDRYGIKQTRSRRGVLIGGGIMVVVLVTWALVITAKTNDKPVRFSSTSIAVRDATRAEITFQVTMKPGSRAVCTLRALNKRSETVGLSDVIVGASEQESFSVTREIATSEMAESGGVKDCALA